MFSFPEWRPHFSLLDTPLANEMMILRWLHLVFGVIWIGLLYFFNLVLTPAMKEVDPAARVRSEEHTSELQSRLHLVCRLLLEKKKNIIRYGRTSIPPPWAVKGRVQIIFYQIGSSPV